MLQNAFHRSVNLGHGRIAEIFSCPSDAISEEDVLNYLKQANQAEVDRVNRFRQLKDKRATIVGRYLLGMALVASNIDLSLDDVALNHDQKPYFPNAKFDFSISHSEGLVLCASIAAFAGHIGVDLEEVRNVSLDEMSCILSDQEIEFVEKSSQPDKALTFLWTAKESVLKARGTGFITEYIPEIVPVHHKDWHGVCHYQGKTYNIMNIDLHSDIVCSIAYLDFRR